jgi:cation diffusion facilitator CzcD-associated flavoprotein CzcO
VDPHFIPNYNPWEQRFCIAPNEILELSEKGKYMVVTDHIDRFLSNGILLKIRKTSSRRHYNHRNGLDVVALRGEIQLDSQPLIFLNPLSTKAHVNEMPNFFILLVMSCFLTLKKQLI